MKSLLLVLSVIVSLVGFVAYSYLFAGCGSTDIDYAKSRVLEHLKRENLPIKYLELDEIGTTDCKVSFTYKSDVENIHFVVIDGGKVTWWDFNAPDQ